MLLPVRFFSIYNTADLGCLQSISRMNEKKSTGLPMDFFFDSNQLQLLDQHGIAIYSEDRKSVV